MTISGLNNAPSTHKALDGMLADLVPRLADIWSQTELSSGEDPRADDQATLQSLVDETNRILERFESAHVQGSQERLLEISKKAQILRNYLLDPDARSSTSTRVSPLDQ